VIDGLITFIFQPEYQKEYIISNQHVPNRFLLKLEHQEKPNDTDPPDDIGIIPHKVLLKED
jgi:hypothetical protein